MKYFLDLLGVELFADNIFHGIFNRISTDEEYMIP